MAIRDIITYPHPVLRQVAESVTNLDGKIQALIDDMAETMYSAPGVGLAANQVGVPVQVIVMDASEKDRPRELIAVINPLIVACEGKIVNEEGCLSLIDFRADIGRYKRVTVKGLDRNGTPIELDKEGLPAVVLQHEIDHLNGILLIDRVSRLKRELYIRRLKKVLMKQASRTR
nr:peptide deformylase [Desulfobacterales bacterium]